MSRRHRWCFRGIIIVSHEAPVFAPTTTISNSLAAINSPDPAAVVASITTTIIIRGEEAKTLARSTAFWLPVELGFFKVQEIDMLDCCQEPG